MAERSSGGSTTRSPAPPPPPIRPAGPHDRRPGGTTIAALVAVGVALLAGGAILAFLLLGGDDDEASPTTSTAAPATIAAPATTAAPAPSTTVVSAAVDRQRAAKIVLTLADLPGYSREPTEPSDPAYDAALAACAASNPLVTQLVKGDTSRGATSADFRKGSGFVVGSGVTFAPSADLARAAIRDLGGSAVASCLSRVESADTAPGWTNVSVATTRLPALTVGDESIGYRTVIRSRSPSGSTVTYAFGMTFIRADRAVAVLYDGGTDGQIPEAERVRLATLLARRMAEA